MKFIIFSAFILSSASVFAKTGYVDMVKVIENTSRGKSVKAKLEAELAKAQKSMRSMENRLKKDKENLEKQVPLLSESARAQKIQKFQQKVLQSQKTAEAKQIELKKLEEKLMNPVVKRIQSVIGRVAAKEGVDIVYNSGKDVLWVSPSLDLTKKVYTKFNKKNK